LAMGEISFLHPGNVQGGRGSARIFATASNDGFSAPYQIP
jgi:hypothetical protein